MTERGQQEPDVPPRISGGGSGDGPDEMGMASKVDHDLDDAVIRGETSGLPDEMVPVAEALSTLRSRALAEPVPPMSAALRAQLDAPNVVALRAARSMRRAVAVAAAAAVVVGVGAAQNRLPSQLQDVVSSTAELVGIEVPRSGERGSARSDEGLEHGRDDTAPNPSAAGEPGLDGPTPGGATPAVPGGPDGPATPATPPEQAERPDKPETPDPPASEPADPEPPDGPPGQDEGTPPSNPQGAGTGDGATTTPPSHPNGAGNNAGGVSATTPATGAPGQDK